MTKPNRSPIINHRLNFEINKTFAHYAAAVLKGAALSIAISIVCALILSVATLFSDNRYLNFENYLEYIMIGVTLASIFIGSAYAAKKAGSRGFLVGVSIGIIYVLFSLGVGSDLGQNQILLPVLGNKLAAGVLAGALGGFIGVNL